MCGVVSCGLLIGVMVFIMSVGDSIGVGMEGCSCWLMSVLSFCEERILPIYGARL